MTARKTTAEVLKFPLRPRRVCEAYLDRAHNATVIILPVEQQLRYRYDFATWTRKRLPSVFPRNGGDAA